MITRALATRPDIRSVVIAAGGANGTAVILSAAGVPGRPPQHSHDFVSRAVWAQRQMVESLDPTLDRSFGMGERRRGSMYALSAPVWTNRARPAALCAAFWGRWPGSQSDALPLLDSYARLASLWVDERPSRVRFDRSRDQATGCLTYAAVLHRLDNEIERSRRTNQDLACCFLTVRPAPGRARGAMADAGELLRSALGERTAIGRFGGQRFIIVLPDVDAEEATAMAGALCSGLEGLAGRDGLTAWAGVAEWIPGTGADQLLGDADRALTAGEPVALN